LAFEADGGLRQTLAERLERFTDKTIIDRGALDAHIGQIATTGYAVEKGEYTEEVNSVAVPIRDYTRTLVGTLAVVGPSQRLTDEAIDREIVPSLLRAGDELSRRLGFAA
jgi:DNA-binding IclR family transcriptional regulator